MALAVTFPEDVTPWVAGSGKPPRGYYYGEVYLKEGTVGSGSNTYKVVEVHMDAPEQMFIPGEAGRLVESTPVPLVAPLFLPSEKSTPEQAKANLGAILGFAETLFGKPLPRGKSINLERKEFRGKIGILFDPAPPGSRGVSDYIRPLAESALEKLLAGEMVVTSWPQENRVTRAGKPDEEGGSKGRGRKGGSGRNQFKGKDAEPEDALDEELDDFAVDSDEDDWS